MAIEDTIIQVEEILRAGMTTDKDSSESWYIHKWYTKDPISLDYRELPIGIIKPSNQNRVDQYVQEDTEVDLVKIYLYPRPINRASNVDDPTESINAMVKRASRLIRRDPTFGARIVDAQVTGTLFRQPGFTEGGVVHNAEMQVQVRQRELWNIDLDS